MQDINFNAIYKDALNSKCRYVHMYGGRGGGRSFTAAQIMLFRIMDTAYFRGVIVRQHLSDIRGSQWQQLIDIIEAADIAHLFDITSHSMKLTCKATGNTVFAKGFRASSGSATGKMKSITEATCVWIEEADEVSYEDFLKLDMSLRSLKSEQLQIILTYNTGDGDSWLKTKHHDRPDDTMLFLKATYLDNIKNLSDSYVKSLEKLIVTSPDIADVWVYGKWGGGVKGRIYNMVQGNWPEHFKSECIGLDFGYTNDPTAIVHIRYTEGELYFKELAYQTGLLNNDIAKLLKQQAPSNIRVYADSAEPKSIDEIRRANVDIVGVKKGAGSLNSGIQKVQQYQLHYSSSPNIAKESRQYHWLHDKDGKPLNKPVDLFNHAMDAIRYGVVGMLGKPQGDFQAFTRRKTYPK